MYVSVTMAGFDLIKKVFLKRWYNTVSCVYGCTVISFKLHLSNKDHFLIC